MSFNSHLVPFKQRLLEKGRAIVRVSNLTAHRNLSALGAVEVFVNVGVKFRIEDLNGKNHTSSKSPIAHITRRRRKTKPPLSH